MRRRLIKALMPNFMLLVFMFSLSGCTDYVTNIQHYGPTVTQKNTDGGEKVKVNDPTKNEMRISLSFNDKKVIVRMYDNPTTRDFLSLLPITINFEDYAGTEKVAYLPRSLSLVNAPGGFDPSPGDFALYAPWGNLAIYYKDFGYSNGLISLGVIEEGLETFAAMSGDFEVLIENLK